MNDAIAELLIRYDLGDFSPRVRSRLEEIFHANPPDALERLANAATFLDIKGITAETMRRAEAQSKAKDLARSVSTSTSQNVSTEKEATS